MRIAMIGQKGIPAHSGGVEQHVEVLARLLARRGHRVDVYCRPSYLKEAPRAGRPGPPLEPGIRVLCRWSLATRSLDAITHTALCTFDALTREADLIHYHALGPASLAFLPRLAGRPVVVTVHGLDWQRAKWGRLARAYLKFGERVAVAAADRLVVVSKPLQRYFHQRYGRASIFIPNGVRELVAGRLGSLVRWGLTAGRYLLSVARLVPEKGQHYLIEAFERLTEAPDLRLAIVGGSDLNSDYEKRLRAMAGPRVVFTGPVGPEVLAELYAKAYLFVLASEIEGMSLALLEAMASGLAVLVSDIPENASVVEGVGFTFRSGRVDDLADQLRRLVARPALVEAAGRAAREAAQAYRWPNVAAALEQVYEELLAARRGGRRRADRPVSCGLGAVSVGPAPRQDGPGRLQQEPQIDGQRAVVHVPGVHAHPLGER